MPPIPQPTDNRCSGDSSIPVNKFDPVDVVYGNTTLNRTDATIATPLGAIEFKRTFSNSPVLWNPQGAMQPYSLEGIPKPFGSGALGTYQATTLWWDSFYGFVYHEPYGPGSPSDYWVVVDLNGHQSVYGTCTFVSGQCTASNLNSNSAWKGSLVAYQYGSTSTVDHFVYYGPDGMQLKFTMANDVIGLHGGGTPHDYYFLDSAYSKTGQLLYSISYARPDPSCPTGATGGSTDAPYLSRITAPGGEQLQVQYKVVNWDGGVECVPSELDSVELSSGTAVDTPLVYYSYTTFWMPDGGSSETGGLLSSVFPADAGEYNAGETYTYYPDSGAGSIVGNLRVLRDGTCFADHEYFRTDVVNHADDWSPGGWQAHYLSYSETGALSSGTCAFQSRVTQTQFTYTATEGDDQGSGNDVTVTDKVISNFMTPSSGNGALHYFVPNTDAISCSGSAACSASTLESNWSCPNTTTPGAETAVADRNQAWTKYDYDGGPQYNRPELTQLERGASSQAATDAMDVTQYTYLYDTFGNQHVATEAKASAKNGSTATTYYTYSSQGRLQSTIRSGYTSNLNTIGGDQFNSTRQYVGTFYFNYAKYSGAGSGSADPYDRVVEVHGPCYVGDAGITDCVGAYPVTQYSYYVTDAGLGNASGMLAAVTRYVQQPDGTPLRGLTTTFDSYDRFGNPTQTTDPNGMISTFAYDQHRLVSSAVNFGTSASPNMQPTTYGYDNEKLTWIKRPSDPMKGEATGYEVFCYRSGTSACTGTWQGSLMWKAKSGSSDGSSPWEKVTYSYWPDGSVKTETYIDGSGNTRRTATFAEDAEQRPTFERWGDRSGSSFVEAKAFDGEQNMTGIGLPFNSPNSLCNHSSTFDPRCAALSYDRLNRLTTLQYPVTTSDLSSQAAQPKTCFTWGDAGAYLEVRNGCSAGADCTLGGASGGCSSNPVSYVYDDFGNVINTFMPWTQDWSGNRGRTVFSYDAMGNVIHQAEPTTQEPDGGVTAIIAYTYDNLGRETSASTYCASGWCTSTTLWTKTYDDPGTPPTGCVAGATALSKGRVYSQSDTFGTTYYQYDVLGQVIAELRDRNGSGCVVNPDGGADWNNHPNTKYAYDYRGNLLEVDYPYGRVAQYAYDGGAGPDRAASVTVTRWGLSGWTLQWTAQKIIDNVQWEPYGGLRAYQVYPGGSPTNDWSVEYQLGTVPTYVTTCDTAAAATTTSSSDHTGRLAQVDVKSGTMSLGTIGDVYNRTYNYQADQVGRIDTCYGTLSTSAHQMEGYGYDAALRLVDAGASGINWSQRNYDVDVYNRRQHENDDGLTYNYTYPTSGMLTDRLTKVKPQPDAGWEYDYAYWNDGQVQKKSTANDSSGGPGMTYLFEEGPSGIDAGAADETVFRAVGLNGAFYNYFYDASNRRRLKQYPSGITDEYFYGPSNELLVDQGNSAYASPTYYTEDDYVWLGGRPVVIAHGNLAASTWVRAADSTTSCGRMGDVGKCGEYYPVTDHIGKVVLMLDSTRNITGTGEYDPFGQVNRVTMDKETGHPYTASATDFADFVPSLASSMVSDVRVKFQNEFTRRCSWPSVTRVVG